MAIDVEDRAGGPRRRLQPWMVALALCLVVTGVWAVLRGSWVPPFGSDNDEYRLVAQARRPAPVGPTTPDDGETGAVKHAIEVAYSWHGKSASEHDRGRRPAEGRPGAS
jgi:hypothetical protein